MQKPRPFVTSFVVSLGLVGGAVLCLAACEPPPKSCYSGFLLQSGADGVLCSEKAGAATVTDHEFGDECTARNDANTVSGDVCPTADRIGKCEGAAPETTADGKVFAAIHYYYDPNQTAFDDARKHCESFTGAVFTPL